MLDLENELQLFAAFRNFPISVGRAVDHTHPVGFFSISTASVVIVAINYSNYETADNGDNGGEKIGGGGVVEGKKEKREKKRRRRRRRKPRERSNRGAWYHGISHVRRISRRENKRQ